MSCFHKPTNQRLTLHNRNVRWIEIEKMVCIYINIKLYMFLQGKNTLIGLPNLGLRGVSLVNIGISMIYPMTDPWCHIWCAMDPIKKYPSHVSINIPAPARSVMAMMKILHMWGFKHPIPITWSIRPTDILRSKNWCVFSTLDLQSMGKRRARVKSQCVLLKPLFWWNTKMSWSFIRPC